MIQQVHKHTACDANCRELWNTESKPYEADDQELVVTVVTLHVAPNCDGSKASWLGDHNGFGMTILEQAQGKRVEWMGENQNTDYGSLVETCFLRCNYDFARDVPSWILGRAYSSLRVVCRSVPPSSMPPTQTPHLGSLRYTAALAWSSRNQWSLEWYTPEKMSHSDTQSIDTLPDKPCELLRWAVWCCGSIIGSPRKSQLSTKFTEIQGKNGKNGSMDCRKKMVEQQTSTHPFEFDTATYKSLISIHETLGARTTKLTTLHSAPGSVLLCQRFPVALPAMTPETPRPGSKGLLMGHRSLMAVALHIGFGGRENLLLT